MTQRGVHVVFVQCRRFTDKVRVVHDVPFDHLFRVHVFHAFFVVYFDAGGAEQELRGVVDRLGSLVGRPTVFGDDIVDVERRVEPRPVLKRLVDVFVRAVLVASRGKRRAHYGWTVVRSLLQRDIIYTHNYTHKQQELHSPKNLKRFF